MITRCLPLPLSFFLSLLLYHSLSFSFVLRSLSLHIVRHAQFQEFVVSLHAFPSNFDFDLVNMVRSVQSCANTHNPDQCDWGQLDAESSDTDDDLQGL